MLLTLFTAAIALADQPKVTRAHFYCLSAVAKLGDDRLRAVPTKDGRSLMLAKVHHGGSPGYYFLDMPSGAEASVAFLDGRMLGALNLPDVKEAFPSELLGVLKKDAAGQKAAPDAAKFARPQAVKSEAAYGALSQDVLAIIREKKAGVPNECHAFGELTAQLTDEAWSGSAPPAAPAGKDAAKPKAQK